MSFLHGVVPSDDIMKRRTLWPPFDNLKSLRGDSFSAHGWEAERREGQLLSPWSSSIPGTVLTFFYSCLQTRRAETDGHCSCNVCSEENEHFIFEKG